MSERILIASNESDTLTTEPVANILEKQGFDVIQYQAGLVSLGKIPFTTAINNNGFEIRYDELVVQPQEIAAAWNRRPNDFGPFYNTEDRSARLCIDRELINSQQLLFDLIPHDRWLNSPDAIRHAGRKLTQLVLAKTIGFEIPNTVVANQWEEITSRLEEGTITYKPFYGELFIGNETKQVHSTPLHNNKKDPPIAGIPYPGIWQDYQPKLQEWRITLVGDDSFDAIVDTDPDAKDDWRRHQSTPKVRFYRGRFPDGEKEKCFEMLRQYNLCFGTFDFVEHPDGRIIFLEMNPNGQYGWLERRLGFRVSEAIARELAYIAIRA